MLKPGDQAPLFTLPDQNGKSVSLKDFKGRKTIVYFYPKDDTPGCTKQACAFKAAYDDFRKADVAVIGISKDSVESHRKFAEKYELPFILLADPELQAIQAYGAWQEKKLYGKSYMGVVRSTFVLDETGRIVKIFPKADPANNAGDILDFLAGKSK